MRDELPLIADMLRQARTIAVVGLSDKPTRASHSITRYLSAQGYHLLGVNPQLAGAVVAGVSCYADLDQAQQAVVAEFGRGIDLVDVFRASRHVPEIVDEAIRLKIPYLWLQDGVEHAEAAGRARAAGIGCVENDCIYRHHVALAAEL
jgi:hypothetical protein